MPEKRFSANPLRREASLLKRRMKEAEDAHGVGLVESMGGSGERFSSQGKSLFKRGATKIINKLLDMREDQLMSSSQYQKMQKRLIDIRELLGNGGK